MIGVTVRRALFIPLSNNEKNKIKVDAKYSF